MYIKLVTCAASLVAVFAHVPRFIADGSSRCTGDAICRPVMGTSSEVLTPSNASQMGISLLQTEPLRLSTKVATNPSVSDADANKSQAPRLNVLMEIYHMAREIPKNLYSIAQDVKYDNVFEEVYTFPERRPRTFNVVLATTKTWLADMFVQLNERRAMVASGQSWSFDRHRSLSFATFGFVYIGLIQWLFYVSIFTILCPNAVRFANEPWQDKITDHQGRVDLVKQVCYDNFILETWIYFPVFYVLKNLMMKGCSGIADMKEKTIDGLMTYARNFKEDNIACYMIWIPADFAVFAAPMWMRMPLEHFVSFGWTMLLSSLRGKDASKVP